MVNNSSYEIKLTARTSNNVQVESSPVLDFTLYTPVTNLGAVVDQRFTVGEGVESECITDNLTGLMWPKNGNLFGRQKWYQSLYTVADINGNDDKATRNNLCGHKDWHLPTVNELLSLMNYEWSNQYEWLENQGFNNVQSDPYWSSTSNIPPYSRNAALYVYFSTGGVSSVGKADSNNSVWPVRRAE